MADEALGYDESSMQEICLQDATRRNFGGFNAYRVADTLGLAGLRCFAVTINLPEGFYIRKPFCIGKPGDSLVYYEVDGREIARAIVPRQVFLDRVANGLLTPVGL